MAEERNETISRIRSCLISTKGLVSLKQLEADYRTLLGERIPYKKLGYTNLESFIISIPSLITTKGPNGELLVDAQVSEKSAHISNMVKKQKSSKKKAPIRMTSKAQHHHPNSCHNLPSSPPTAPNKWRPKKKLPMGTSQTRQNGNTSKLAALSHNQFVHAYRQPVVPSKILIPGSNNDITAQRGKEVLQSTKKRISKLMSEISLERDSGNSSPTAEYPTNNYKPPQTFATTPATEFNQTGDAINDLKQFVQFYKIGDIEVKFTETKPKGSRVPLCHCKIKIGQHIYSSYPKDFFDRHSAEQHASQKALDDLQTKYKRRKSLLISSNYDIIERIPPMLKKHQSAVWMWQIEADYIDKYMEQLPKDWLQVIDSSLYVSIEKCLGGYVLKYCNPNDVLQKGKKMEFSLNLDNVSVPCNTVQFDANNQLYGIVTLAVSTNEIWCQHCNTPEYNKFLALVKKMEDFYNLKKIELIPKNINVGCYYVINHDDSWRRARILSITPKQQDGDSIINCFLIDFGEEVQVSLNQIFILKREFALEQAQAFVCRLDGLEEYIDLSIDSDHLQNLVGNQYVLEMVLDECSGDRSADLTIPVVMYDLNTKNSVNEELINLLTIESARPILDKDAITEVYVSNIEGNGDVYVQIRSPGYYNLLEILKTIESTLAQKPNMYLLEQQSLCKEGHDNNLIYLIENKITQNCQRVKIIDWSPRGNLAQIYFIDYGNADVINVKNEILYPLWKLDKLCNEYPEQAVKVRINLEKIPENFVEKARKLMPENSEFLLKIIDFNAEDNIPNVEFFKRSNDGGLFCINKSISVEAELKANNNDKLTRKRLINLTQFNDKTVPSGGSLKIPELPSKGNFFNVNIPFAVNPWNFFVQPWDTISELTSLMEDMQNFYNNLQCSPLQLDDIKPGKIYASKHDDGSWYRTSVLKVIHPGCISVFYCDFGYYTSLTVAQLVPLQVRYMDLPYQALKAKLADIKPKNQKWTMDDCDFFNNLVVKKQFVSILIDIEKDELYKSDFVLSLSLVDTSGVEDIYIKDILIQEGIAINN